MKEYREYSELELLRKNRPMNEDKRNIDTFKESFAKSAGQAAGYAAVGGGLAGLAVVAAAITGWLMTPKRES